ncbi:MAG: potassium-transporting ATPase subunit KdpC [Chloroflexi bacterium]|nr:potassium-transporting ATPase subunit KdpC [Chloroflexota bacterium]
MLKNAYQDLRTTIIAFVLFSALFGLAYPYAITGIAQVAFPGHADGSFITVDGQIVGSSLVGQTFEGPPYFHSRPSASGYETGVSSGSNLGPASQDLAERVDADVAAVREANGLAPDAKVPVDAVTTSASGLDPHITPAYADIQVARVASERGVSEDEVRKLVDKYTDDPTLWLLGESRVNVLKLNLALDEAFGIPGARAPRPRG